MDRLALASTLALCTAVPACVDKEDNGSATDGVGATGAIGLTPGDPASGTTGIDIPEPVEKLDLPDDGPTDIPATAGCKKADFLFVIDNSGSMADEQANLIASFPGFISTITDTLAAKDYHIMAVSTDDGAKTGLNSSCINGDCSCTPAPVCCENACGGSGVTCNGFQCDNLPLSQCDYEYGTGKTFDADGKHCMLEGDRRYMLASQPDLAQAFECIANVGTYGSGDERPMLAALSALSPEQNGPGGCDEGFLRDDAILVLTFITDEEDDGNGSPGAPADWYNAVVAAKNGDEKAVVVLGLVGDSNLPMATCTPGVDPNGDGQGAEAAPRLQSFVQMFSNGVVGSVCAPDYTPFFHEAVSVIDLACDEFEPPG